MDRASPPSTPRLPYSSRSVWRALTASTSHRWLPQDRCSSQRSVLTALIGLSTLFFISNFLLLRAIQPSPLDLGRTPILQEHDQYRKLEAHALAITGAYIRPELPQDLVAMLAGEDAASEKLLLGVSNQSSFPLDKGSAQENDDEDHKNDEDDDDEYKPPPFPSRLTPPFGGPDNVVPAMPQPPEYDERTLFELTWNYLKDEKFPPYVGNEYWMNQFPKGSRAWLNSLATFPYECNDLEPMRRFHGRVGVYPNGTQYWKGGPMPPPIKEVNRTEEMKIGGFYLKLANALPLDRKPDDTRDEICKQEVFNYNEMEDAAVVITFYNEPLSTLLRSVHSVLNNTPPPLLREIILVDDHSNLEENLPGSELYEYVKLLPKTKILRLPERRGLVWARLAGAQAAKAPVLVVLDSHIEVNDGWMEPQLKRLSESPNSIVAPQIMALEADAFTYNAHAGIGCWLSWKWNMVEQASLTGALTNTSAIPSASMAGGLFAVRLEWFWEIGGYDEKFSMWGSENVEMGFRTWQCGGRLECTPCARTYHIYRSGGIGYVSPSRDVIRNKHRTARVWMDEWYQIAKHFISQGDESDVGNLDDMLELKEKLKCKPFSWFLQNVDPTHEGQELKNVEILGEIRSRFKKHLCLDSLGNTKPNKPYGVYMCHGLGGSQGWFKDRTSRLIRNYYDDQACLTNDHNATVFGSCRDGDSNIWTIENGKLIAHKGLSQETCLTIGSSESLHFESCSDAPEQLWDVTPFKLDPDFELPTFSPEYLALHGSRGAPSVA